ncbi:MAG TPA: hypothetical protein VNJ09_06925 [Chthonomonadales bacterium]|nr:hypothetical protein [Chthonomonadales bacterium]
MPGIQQVKTFWKTLKSVSISEIARESEHPVVMAVVGEPEKRKEVLRKLFPDATEEDILPERSLVRNFDSTSKELGFPTDTFDFVIDAGGGRADATNGLKIYSVPEVGGWERLVQHILDEHPELSLSLARRFPGFREEVSQRIIKDTAISNAEFAMLNALPGLVPILGPLLSLGGISDLLMLTKNQAMMLFRLAAAHDLPLDLRSRARDIAPLLGNAFGWRAIAREVVGVVPGGVGLAARGAIAYAGTIAIGQALHRFYHTGQLPTRAQINRFYREALAGAREIVRQKLLKKHKPAAKHPVLPAPDSREEG